MTTAIDTAPTVDKSNTITLKVIGIVVAIAIASQFLFGSPQPVQDAATLLAKHYSDQRIYNPVSCDTNEVDSDWFVLCRQNTAATIGGLYHIVLDGDRFFIAPLNGKARQHTEQASFVTYEPPKAFDISSVLSEF